MEDIPLDPLRVYHLALSLDRMVLIQQLQGEQLMQLGLVARVALDLDRDDRLVGPDRLEELLEACFLELVVAEVKVAHVLVVLHPGVQAAQELVCEAVLAEDDGFQADLVDVVGVFAPETGGPDLVVLAFGLLLEELYEKGSDGVPEAVVGEVEGADRLVGRHRADQELGEAGKGEVALHHDEFLEDFGLGQLGADLLAGDLAKGEPADVELLEAF